MRRAQDGLAIAPIHVVKQRRIRSSGKQSTGMPIAPCSRKIAGTFELSTWL